MVFFDPHRVAGVGREPEVTEQVQEPDRRDEKERQPEIRDRVLSRHAAVQYVRKAQRDGADGDPHPDRHLLDRAVQRIGRGHIVFGNIGEGERRQRTELHRAHESRQEQRQHDNPYRRGRQQQGRQKSEQGYEAAVYDQHAAETETADDPHGSRLHRQVADHRRQEQQSRLERTEPEPDLEHQRNQVREHADHHPRNRTGVDRDPVAFVLHHRIVDQRIVDPFRIKHVGEQYNETPADKPQRYVIRKSFFAEQLHAVHESGQRQAAQDEPRSVERFAGTLAALLGRDITPGEQNARDADRNVQVENPPPRQESRQIAADQRADDRRDQRRNRDVVHRDGQVLFGRRFQHGQAAHRRHHRPGHPLHHPVDHELQQRLRRPAQRRGEDKKHDRRAEHVARPEPVGDPTADRNKDRQRDQVRSDARTQMDNIRPEGARHGRNSRIDRRGVEKLHEKRNGHHQRYPNRFIYSHPPQNLNRKVNNFQRKRQASWVEEYSIVHR